MHTISYLYLKHSSKLCFISKKQITKLSSFGVDNSHVSIFFIPHKYHVKAEIKRIKHHLWQRFQIAQVIGFSAILHENHCKRFILYDTLNVTVCRPKCLNWMRFVAKILGGSTKRLNYWFITLLLKDWNSRLLCSFYFHWIVNDKTYIHPATRVTQEFIKKEIWVHSAPISCSLLKLGSSYKIETRFNGLKASHSIILFLLFNLFADFELVRCKSIFLCSEIDQFTTKRFHFYWIIVCN